MVNELALKKIGIEAVPMIIENSTSNGTCVKDYVCKDVLVGCGDYDFKCKMAANIQKNMGGHHSALSSL